MRLVKAGQLSPGNMVSINGVSLEVVRILPTQHKEPHVALVFNNGQSRIANVNEVFFVLETQRGSFKLTTTMVTSRTLVSSSRFSLVSRFRIWVSLECRFRLSRRSLSSSGLG